jgi:hypothetical protein
MPKDHWKNTNDKKRMQKIAAIDGADSKAELEKFYSERSPTVNYISENLLPTIMPFAESYTAPTGVVLARFIFTNELKAAIEKKYDEIKQASEHLGDRTPQFLLTSTLRNFASNSRCVRENKDSGDCTIPAEELKKACAEQGVEMPASIKKALEQRSVMINRSGDKNHPNITNHQPGGRD